MIGLKSGQNGWLYLPDLFDKKFMNLFPLVLKLQGYSFKNAEEYLSNIQKYSIGKFDQWHYEMRWGKFEFHYHNNIAYRDFITNQAKKRPTAWDEIPILKKNWLQQSIKEVITPGLRDGDIYLSNTSGSSGHPFFFAKDKFCHAMTWALIIDRYRWHGVEYGNSLQARFYGVSLDVHKNLSERLKDFVFARNRFNVFDLSDIALDGFIDKFSATKFDYINGYTSVLVVFAKYLISKKLILKAICPTLKVAITTSEVLDDSDRAILNKGFGVPVVNEYGASELDIIAFEDQDQDWIISNENIFIEIVDDNGKPSPDGETGRIIVTSLHNRAMPFIRYEIGDIGSISTRRKGKYQILESLQGRTNDVIVLPGGKRAPGLTFYYISKKLLEDGGFIKEFIIKQKSIDHFHFEYVASSDLTDRTVDQIKKAMTDYLEAGLKVTFSRFDHLERNKAGKLMHFQKEF